MQSAISGSTRSASPWRNTTPSAGCATKDLGGLAVDAKAKLKDGTEFEGIDGLRTYLLTKKKDVIVRLFCRKLLGLCSGANRDAVGPVADRRDGGGVEQERRATVGGGA